MREIKFRYLIGGEWHYFDMDTIEGAMACSEVMSQKYEARNLYTGLKDKNGVEIYDGDIVTCFTDTPSRVVFNKGAFGYQAVLYKEVISFAQNTNIKRIDGKMQEIEVIGNIFEHENLIKDAKGI